MIFPNVLHQFATLSIARWVGCRVWIARWQTGAVFERIGRTFGVDKSSWVHSNAGPVFQMPCPGLYNVRKNWMSGKEINQFTYIYIYIYYIYSILLYIDIYIGVFVDSRCYSKTGRILRDSPLFSCLFLAGERLWYNLPPRHASSIYL